MYLGPSSYIGGRKVQPCGMKEVGSYADGVVELVLLAFEKAVVGGSVVDLG